MPPDGSRLSHQYLVLDNIRALQIISLRIVKYVCIFRQDGL